MWPFLRTPIPQPRLALASLHHKHQLILTGCDIPSRVTRQPAGPDVVRRPIQRPNLPPCELSERRRPALTGRERLDEDQWPLLEPFSSLVTTLSFPEQTGCFTMKLQGARLQ